MQQRRTIGTKRNACDGNHPRCRDAGEISMFVIETPRFRREFGVLVKQEQTGETALLRHLSGEIVGFGQATVLHIANIDSLRVIPLHVFLRKVCGRVVIDDKLLHSVLLKQGTERSGIREANPFSFVFRVAFFEIQSSSFGTFIV